METLILWFGFIGSWLLVAGSVYQAALELKEEGLEQDRITELSNQVKKIPKVSIWWWFIPPIKIILERRYYVKYQKAFLTVMNKKDTEAMLAFNNKASAWIYVGSGGFLIASKETYELFNHFNFPSILTSIFTLLFLVLCILNTIIRLELNKKVLATK